MRCRSAVTKTIVLLVLVVIPESSNSSERQRPLTICDLLTSPCLYENKRVVVRAEELPGGHGPYFSGASCMARGTPPGVQKEFVTLELPQQDDPALGLSVDESIRAVRVNSDSRAKLGLAMARGCLLPSRACFRASETVRARNLKNRTA